MAMRMSAGHNFPIEMQNSATPADAPHGNKYRYIQSWLRPSNERRAYVVCRTLSVTSSELNLILGRDSSNCPQTTTVQSELGGEVPEDEAELPQVVGRGDSPILCMGGL